VRGARKVPLARREPPALIVGGKVIRGAMARRRTAGKPGLALKEQPAEVQDRMVAAVEKLASHRIEDVFGLAGVAGETLDLLPTFLANC